MFWKSSSHDWHGTLSRNWPGTRRLRPRFCILKVLGDVLDDGELHFVERATTLEAARRRIGVLAEATPGQYVIYNGKRANGFPLLQVKSWAINFAGF